MLIDAGFSSQVRFRNAISDIRERFGPIKALVVTHAHTDHVNYSTLKVVSSMNLPIFLSLDTVERLATFPNCIEPLKNSWVELYDENPFQIADLIFNPFPVVHAPNVPNCGFVIEGEGVRIGFATDLCETRDLHSRLSSCDLLYIESNYDPTLLRENPNPNSRFHLSNDNAALFVAKLVSSGVAPKMVLLGHLSTQRNRPDIVTNVFKKRLSGLKDVPQVFIAPAFEYSETCVVHPRAGTYVTCDLLK